MRSERVVVGLVLVALGVLLLLERAGVYVSRGVVLAAALIFVGIALLVQARRRASAVLLAGGVVLVVILAFDERPAGPLGVELPPDTGPRRTVSDSMVIDAPADEIDMDVDAATVTVTTSPGPVGVDWRATYRARRPTVRSELDGGTIELDAECPGTFGVLGGDCRMEIDVQVPPGMDVGIDAGAGDVSIAGVDGDVSVDTGSGTVTISAVSGGIVVDTGSGSVAGDRLTAMEARIETGSGSVSLAFTGRPPDLVDVSTGSGRVSIEVPPADYRIETDTGSGGEDVRGIGDDPAAARTITVETGSGSISILGRRPLVTPAPPTFPPTPSPVS